MLDMNPILQMSNSRSMIDKRTTNDVASESESTSSTASQNAHHHPSNDRHGIPGVLFSTGPPSSSSHSSSNLTGTLDSDRSSISGPLNDSHSTLAESLSTNSTSSSEESSGSADEEDSQSDDDERSQDTLFQISHHPHLLHHHHHHHRGAPIGRKFPGHDKSDLFLKSLEVDPFAPTKFFGEFINFA